MDNLKNVRIFTHFCARLLMFCPLWKLLTAKKTTLPFAVLDAEINSSRSKNDTYTKGDFPFESLPEYKNFSKAIPNKKCLNKTGIAVKIIRLCGRLSQIYQISEFLNEPLDLIIHLIRDPRAVLASRYSVGWGTPLKRDYESTLSWATSVCSHTMIDHTMNRERKNYYLLRYEDLSLGVEKNLETIYMEKLGLAVDKEARSRAREYDGCKSGTSLEKKECLENAKKDKKNKNKKYNTSPRNFAEMISKWRKSLNKDEVRAVELGCRKVFETIFPDMELLS
mmetsp:Transcript_16447/g.24364  ORF Transcript_16447/g.24364 Transcript_16447/m.24364 type:complete len:280 (+) Transcript_16447:364-1203(+)